MSNDYTTCPDCSCASRVVNTSSSRRRQRRCPTCSTSWRTFEISEERYRALLDAEAQVLRAKVDARDERERRMRDIRFAVRALFPYAMRDEQAMLAIEQLKSRGEFLHEWLEATG